MIISRNSFPVYPVNPGSFNSQPEKSMRVEDKEVAHISIHFDPRVQVTHAVSFSRRTTSSLGCYWCR